VRTYNEAYSTLRTPRRYEAWFLRLGLADGSGALWIRYLLMNPGRAGFPRGSSPQNIIQGFPLHDLELSQAGATPFRFAVGENSIGEDSCRGRVRSDGKEIAWDLRYRSTCRVSLSSKGWIGFSRTPHPDALFSGEISVNGQSFRGDAFATGVQGHNCGYRHRNFWTWMHAYFPRPHGAATTLEALTYEMPLGLIFRKAVLCHEGKLLEFRGLRTSVRRNSEVKWVFTAKGGDGAELEIEAGGDSVGIHHAVYVKTDCSGTFEVANNSLTSARIRLTRASAAPQEFVTQTGAVVEMAGA